MQLKDVISACELAIPQSKTWRGCFGEVYGNPRLGQDTREIRRVLYCVTASPQIVDYAHSHGFDLIIAHHPLGLSDFPMLVYHTALDCCAGGLNDQWAHAIGMPNPVPFDDPLGAVGTIRPCTMTELLRLCEAFSGRIVGAIRASGDLIQRVVICTGLGGMVVPEVERLNADCYITGQLTQDPGMIRIPNLIEIGHTLSERCGVITLRNILGPHGITVEAAPLILDVFSGETYQGSRAPMESREAYVKA